MKKKIILMILCICGIYITQVFAAGPYDSCVNCTHGDCCVTCQTIACTASCNSCTEGDCCSYCNDVNTPGCIQWRETQDKISLRNSNCANISSNYINENTIMYLKNRGSYCCFDGGTINSDYSCDLLDIVYDTKAQCPAIANEINGNTVDYVKIKDGYCCFDGGGVPHGDLTCGVQLAKYSCPSIASQITLSNARSVSLDSCCFSLEEAGEDDCSFLGSNYVQEGDCCIMGEGCANPPQNGECESGYKLENSCCVPLSCEEENSEAKVTCDARRNSGEAVKRSTGTCKCVCDPSKGCCGVKLNTVVPFIGDCIEMTNGNDTTQGVNQLNAFPYLMKGITKILITAIMIFSIIIVIAAGFLMSTSVASEGNYKKGVELLKNVLICLILLGCSGLILKLVNPNFFG